jgi:hypothetical protein
VILKVLPDTRQMLNDRYTELFELSFVADAGLQ